MFTLTTEIVRPNDIISELKVGYEDDVLTFYLDGIEMFSMDYGGNFCVLTQILTAMADEIDMLS